MRIVVVYGVTRSASWSSALAQILRCCCCYWKKGPVRQMLQSDKVGNLRRDQHSACVAAKAGLDSLPQFEKSHRLSIGLVSERRQPSHFDTQTCISETALLHDHHHSGERRCPCRVASIMILARQHHNMVDASFGRGPLSLWPMHSIVHTDLYHPVPCNQPIATSHHCSSKNRINAADTATPS